MANAAICGTNKAALVSVAASSQEILMPASNLRTPHVEERWRSKSNIDFVVTALLSSFDTIAVRGMSAGVSATVRVRVSSADSTGAAGDLYDSGSLAHGSAQFDANYGAITCLLNSVVSGYVRVDINDPGKTYVEAGILFVDQRTTFTYNFGYGWQIQWEDRSAVQESRGGQDLVWRDNRRRHVALDFKLITTTQRYGIVETIDRDNGINASVLVITDTASTNLARDAIVGLVESLTAIVQPDPVFDTDGPLFSKSYQIKERL